MLTNKRKPFFGSIINRVAVAVATRIGSDSNSVIDDTGVVQPRAFAGAAVNFKTIGDMGGSSGGTVNIASKASVSEHTHAGYSRAGDGEQLDTTASSCASTCSGGWNENKKVANLHQRV